MLLLGPLLSLASAAVVTEVPPFLRGDITVGYAFDLTSGSLLERADTELELGKRSLSDHMLRYSLEFSVAPGAAVFAELPHYVGSSVSYDAMPSMVYDPSTGSGTYQGTASGEGRTAVSGAGLGGIWFGVRGTPFSESFAKRNSSVTWLLEGAVRTADASNFWTVNEDGKRGAGPGGTAARFHTAFSTNMGNTAPYVSGTYVGEGKHTAIITSPDGTVGPEVEVDPANSGNVRVGVELLAGRNPASGSLVVFDLHMGVGYASFGVIPSGFYLPDVLDASAGDVVVQSEQLEGGGGLTLHWRPFENMQLGLNGDIAYHMPQRIEYPYPVYTGGDTVRVTTGLDLTVRFR